MNVMRQTACLVVNPITVDNFADLDVSGLRLNDGSGIKLSIKLAGAWCSVFGRAHRASTVGLPLLQHFRVGLTVEYSSCFILLMNLNLYVHCFDTLMNGGPSRGPNKCYIYDSRQNMGRGLLQREAGLSPTKWFIIDYQGGASIVVYSSCICSSASC